MAARSHLALDVNNAFHHACGSGGLTEGDYEALLPRLSREVDALVAGRQEGRLPYLNLPRDEAARNEALALARSLREDFDTLVVLGIGGSSLGARAVFGALSHPFHNLRPASERAGMRVFFPDNSDPGTFAALLDVLELPHTAFAVVTKSGGTAETMSQFAVVKAILEQMGGPAALRRHVVAVTDPDKGALRAIARTAELRTLSIPSAVGGRFSVMTGAGLLPAACAGMDVEALLEGAASMAERALGADVARNPAALLAGLLHAMDTSKRRPVHVFMPYNDALRDTGDWFVQLWAESLGKRGPQGPSGPTPLRAVGATDQHSLLQLLMEGPEDKFVLFVQVEEPRADLIVPSVFSQIPDVAYLGGTRMSHLLDAERRATALALARQGRPTATIRLPRLDAFHLGELVMLLEAATSIAGSLYGVDPYDQPGVELGKRYTSAILGRPGYENVLAEIAVCAESRPHLVVS